MLFGKHSFGGIRLAPYCHCHSLMHDVCISSTAYWNLIMTALSALTSLSTISSYVPIFYESNVNTLQVYHNRTFLLM
jgi:hypothetical protein